jgi:predicted RNA-binding Zn ribbon-like protein
VVTVSAESGAETGFTFVSGDVALDFAGTLRNRRTRREELLRGPEDLARWLVLAGVLDHEPVVEAAQFAAAVELREAVYLLAQAKLAGRALPQAPLAAVNARAGQSGVVVRLAESGALCRAGGALEALAAIAQDAVRLLGSDALLRQCGADNCTRIFVDRSRRGDRRWCEMAGCGNRDKARAHRERAHRESRAASRG